MLFTHDKLFSTICFSSGSRVLKKENGINQLCKKLMVHPLEYYRPNYDSVDKSNVFVGLYSPSMLSHIHLIIMDGYVVRVFFPELLNIG